MTTATDWDGLFKAGIAAYQQGDYVRAIASLTQLSRANSSTYRTKANMGLVRVFMAQKDWTKAKSLCQEIGQSSNLSVQQWVHKTLTKIEQHIAQSTVKPKSLSPSGFQPLSTDVAGLGLTNGLKPPSDRPLVNPEPVSQAEPRVTDVSPEVTAVAADVSDESQTEDRLEWTYAGRLPKGRSLGAIKPSQRRAAQIGGAIAFFLLLRFMLLSAIALINSYLYWLDSLLPFWVRQISLNPRDLTWKLLATLIVLALASPWLWDLWLRWMANRQAFSNQKLRTYSPEAATLLGRHCHQRGWSFPTLWKLPTAIPLIFSYGWRPRNARLVVSEGLLNQLEADEIATLVAYELAHWTHGYWPLLSLQGIVLQLFHQIYWRLALWGNSQPKYFQWPMGVLATLSYGAFWLLRIPGLWVSRVRTYYGDRTAAAATGNPNSLARALAKLSFGMAASIEQQSQTPALIENAALLLPVSPDLARYRLYSRLPLGQLFTWDSLNPLRTWMSVSDAHPPLGDRLQRIMAYAQHWHLETEIQLPAPSHHRKGLSPQNWQLLMRQATPFVGLAAGVGLGVILWIVGAVAQQLEFAMLDWMYKDEGLFQCCWLLGLAIGTILRINRFFPDLSFEIPQTQTMSHWVIDPDLLPVSSLATKLSGTVIGRPGLANWLGQDLLLKTPLGLHKLHFFSILGPLGNVIRFGEQPTIALGKSVQVLGWFRRGNQPWIDIDKIRLSNGLLLPSAHPMFSLLIAILVCSLGLWQLIQSN